MATKMVRMAQLLLMAACIALGVASVDHASADGASGWYGPYDESGCSFYSNDGVTLSNFSYCPDSSGVGGWFGPYDDGCYGFSNDSATLTGFIFCPSGLGAGLGWYGPFDDGCLYDWEAYGWTGVAYCPSSTETAAQSSEPQGDVITTTTDGTPAVVWADGSVTPLAPGSGGCGSACQPQTSAMPIPTDDGVGVWVEPRTQPAYTPGCEFVREDYCYPQP